MILEVFGDSTCREHKMRYYYYYQISIILYIYIIILKEMKISSQIAPLMYVPCCINLSPSH